MSVAPSSGSLQRTYAPQGRCFGCGPANEKGLRIESFVRGEGDDAEVVCDWVAEPHHEAFEGVLNGGILGALLDCHSNWTGAWALMRARGLAKPPTTVTADFHVKLRRPTPSGRPVHLVARPVSIDGDFVKVAATLTSDGKVTATCDGTFVAVGPGHPAYERW